MAGTIPYLQWRNGLCTEAPDRKKIGEDILILKHTDRSDFVRGPFRLDLTLSVFLKKGSCRFMTDMTEHTAAAPCMYTVISGHIFQIIDASPNLEACTILMSEKFSEGLFAGLHGPGQLQDTVSAHPVIDLAGDSAVFEEYIRMLEMLAESPLNRYSGEAAKHLTLAMFYGYSYRFHDMDENRRESQADSLLYRFEAELRQSYRRERSVAFYASRLCVTPKYLSYAVRRLTGHTASEYIERYVTTECKALLLSTDMTVQQISDTLNFPSQSVFGKYFKRTAGISPREYRKKNLFHA